MAKVMASSCISGHISDVLISAFSSISSLGCKYFFYEKCYTHCYFEYGIAHIK